LALFISNVKNKVALVIAVSAFIYCLLVVVPAKSDENHFVRLTTSRQHPSALALDDAAGKGMVIGIDASHLLRLMEMDHNLYVLYIGDGTEFERWFGGSKKAEHFTLKQIKENTLQFPKDRTLVLICPSGEQSPAAAKILSARGYVVYYVIGGMKALNKLENHKPMFMKEKHDQENGGKTIRQKKNEQHHPEFIFEEEDMGC
jgi:rhodanese-related sulfurtransferase